MNQEKAQLFLSIMDTLHDFTGPRIQSVEGGKMIHQVIEDMILRLLRPEVNEIIKHLRDVDSSFYEELIGFLEVMYKERDFYGMGNLIPPENVERSTKHMMMKYVLHAKNYNPMYTPKRDMGTGEANNVWKNRENMYRDYHRYTTDVIQINIGDKTEGTGIFATEDISTQAKSMYDYLCMVYNAHHIVYVPDANSLGKDMVCLNDIGHPTVYKGLFDKYDFGNTGFSGGAPKKKPTNISTNAPTCVQNEFQNYQLQLKDRELLKLPTMRVEFDSMLSTYILKHRDDIDLQFKHKRQGGVPLFLDCLLKMRTFLGSMHHMTPKEKLQLEQELQSQALQIIQGMYRVILSKEDMKDRDKVRAYLLSLFDLKRAGDYLAVKACAEANRNAAEGTKYVFISNDQLAILYALMQNVPCIQTTLMGRKKDKLFLTIYNIHREPRTKPEKSMRSDDPSDKTKTRTVVSRMHLISPKVATTRPSVASTRTPAQQVAKDLGKGTFVATTLQKNYARKNITNDEYTEIKSAIIELSDDDEKQRTHAKLGTLKRSVRKTLKTPKQEGGIVEAEPEELMDFMFVDFVNMVNKLKLSFPPFFWIIFRFVFMHIQPSDYYELSYNERIHPSSTPNMRSASHTPMSNSVPNTYSITIHHPPTFHARMNQRTFQPSVPKSTSTRTYSRMVGKGAD